MEIVNAYAAVGSYRGAAALCGTTHKTVKRVLERLEAGQVEPRVPPPSNTAGVVDLVTQKVQATDGRISAKRLLAVARAAGYTGSARTFRRAVATAKRTWKRECQFAPDNGLFRTSWGPVSVSRRSPESSRKATRARTEV